MSAGLGENLEREWDQDLRSPEIWDALQTMEIDPTAGMRNLETLAAEGSSLGMMHLGHIYISGQYGVKKRPDIGEDWLRKSFEYGSIEGGYRLAKYLQISNCDNEALQIYENLAIRGYAPAMFVLGQEYYLGNIVPKSIDISLSYFSKATSLGHIYAAQWKSKILMKDVRTPISWILGFWCRIRMFIPAIRALKFPNSDLLRR